MNSTSPPPPATDESLIDIGHSQENDLASTLPELPSPDSSSMVGGHDVERAVLHRLKNHPSLKFTRLDVHRCKRDAVCIEGFLESNDEEIDLCEVVRGIHGIREVVNRVVTSQPRKK